MLFQAFGNIILNALQALESSHFREERILITCFQCESGSVAVQIIDSGPGIDPSISSLLFNPFVTTKARGTGLGLSFVKKVIEEQGGHVSLMGETDLKGAGFEVLLKS